MLRLLLIAAAGAGVWYFFLRGERALTQENVRRLVDEADAAYLAGDVVRECQLRTREWSAREYVQNFTADGMPMDFERMQRGERDHGEIDTDGGDLDFVPRTRKWYCQSNPEMSQTRMRRTALEITIRPDGTARYLARYVTLRPVERWSAAQRRYPDSQSYMVTDELATVMLQDHRPKLASSQTISRSYWLKGGEITADGPLPGP